MKNSNKDKIGWWTEKYLKHVSDKKIKSFKYKEFNIKYSNGPELVHGLKELFLEHVYKQSFNKNSLIIDCGSYIGLSTIYYKHLCPECKIICFEPDDKNFQILTQNIEANKITNVELHKQVVWIENTTLSFASDGNMGSRITEGAGKQISAVRLKDFLTEKITFLKIDIEGAEYEVIKDIETKLHLVDNLFLEYHSSYNDRYKFVELINILQQNGFCFYIKEAANVNPHPFTKEKTKYDYDIQLNIFCFRL